MQVEPDGRPLRPLTKRTAEGILYVRDPKHERHIRRALSVPVREIEGWIKAFGYGEKRYADLPADAPSPEALVYLYRHFLAEVEQFSRERQARARSRAERILRALLEGIHAAVASHLPDKLRRVPQNRKETCIEEVEGYVLVRLNDPGDAADILEVAFGLALRLLCIKITAGYRMRGIAEISPLDTLPDLEDDAPDPARLLDGERAMRAFEHLTPDHKTLLKRRVIQDPPTLQADLAHEQGVTVKTIRNRERAAEAALRARLGENE